MRRREFVRIASGAALAWPLAARAQQSIPVVGWLSSGSRESDAFRVAALRRGLAETGYFEDQNVAIEYRWAEGRNDRLPDLAADLVRRQVAVIMVAGGAPPASAAKAATATIPIVFAGVIDPVRFGLVASLNRPGGNTTGFALPSGELAAKRLELLHELLPTTPVVALLVNPANPLNQEIVTASLRDAAKSLGLQAHVLQASTESEIDAAFARLGEVRAGALIVSDDTYFTNRRDQVLALATRHAVPAIYAWSVFPAGGGLMSYGTDLADLYRQAGAYVGRIIKGAKPSDLPVQQVVKLELVINLKTAKALGLTVPQILLARADEVIE